MAKETENTQRSAGLTDPTLWLERYGDSLYNFAYTRVRNDALAEELVQEALVSALRSKDTFKGLASEKSWLTSILKNKIIDHFRKEAREKTVTDDTLQDQAVDAMFDRTGHWSGEFSQWNLSPDDVAVQRDFYRVLESCIQALPEKIGKVFVLRDVDEMEAEEICKLLNITPTNLWVILHRARMRLKKCLETNWFSAR